MESLILVERLKILNGGLHSHLLETIESVEALLVKYDKNFPTYTDHSLHHTREVLKIAGIMLNNQELNNLNADEIYVLSMACCLHDIGMCIPEEKINEIAQASQTLEYRVLHPDLSTEEYIRNIHHELSYQFIMEEWKSLKIPNIKYAKAIGLVSQGHRKVDIGNFDIYDPKFYVKSGREFVCLPYLSAILRIADELDITNHRTPKLLTKYYMPNNEVSVKEWNKHMATSQFNINEDKAVFEVDCSDYNIYAALQDQFDKIQNVIYVCQKTIRSIVVSEDRSFSLNLKSVNPKYNFIGFDPKGIRFSFDVQNVVTAFIGKNLYKDKLTSLREAVQNSIDSCRYKSKVLKENYTPLVKILVTEKYIKIEDNGAGMDEFIIETFFGRLGSSFYEQEKIKNDFEAIGQFGVGVFSYFLLCDYVDIETKMNPNKTLRFRFDKDPKSYFHFYNTTERLEEGTTITLNLQKEIQGTIEFSVVESYIRNIFRHIEFPIFVESENNSSEILFNPLSIDSASEIKNRIKLHNKKWLGYFKMVSAKIKNDEYEGECSIIIHKDPGKIFQVSSAYFDYDKFKGVNDNHSHSQVSLSQKGVFVNNYSASFLRFVIGKIDFKRKIQININRTEFSDIDQVMGVIQKFELEILKKIFTELKDFKDFDLVNLSEDFISYYLNAYNYKKPQNYLPLLSNELHFRFFDGKEIKPITLSDLIRTHKCFFLLSEHDDIDEVWSKFKIPIVVINGWRYEGSYYTLRNLICNLTLKSTMYELVNKRGYEIFKLDSDDGKFESDIKKMDELDGLAGWGVTQIEGPYILFNIGWSKKSPRESYFHESASINYNHQFIQFIINNLDSIKNSVEYREIVRAAIEFIFELQSDDSNIEVESQSIRELNNLLFPLNKINKLNKFTSKDFYSNKTKK